MHALIFTLFLIRCSQVFLTVGMLCAFLVGAPSLMDMRDLKICGFTFALWRIMLVAAAPPALLQVRECAEPWPGALRWVCVCGGGTCLSAL